MTSRELTIKQAAFKDAFILTGNGAEAYRRAYDVKTMSQKAITVEVARLVKNPRVALAIQQERAKLAKNNAVSIAAITEMLIADRKQARKNNQPAAAIAAALGLAKLHGLIVDKKKITTQQANDLCTISDAALSRIISKSSSGTQSKSRYK